MSNPNITNNNYTSTPTQATQATFTNERLMTMRQQAMQYNMQNNTANNNNYLERPRENLPPSYNVPSDLFGRNESPFESVARDSAISSQSMLRVDQNYYENPLEKFSQNKMISIDNYYRRETPSMSNYDNNNRREMQVMNNYDNSHRHEMPGMNNYDNNKNYNDFRQHGPSHSNNYPESRTNSNRNTNIQNNNAQYQVTNVSVQVNSTN